jgi:hypothetical protein
MMSVENLRSADELGARVEAVAEAPQGDVSEGDLTRALEEGCGVLLVLEASRARIAGGGHGLYATEVHLTEAIGSLRQALALLREQTRGDATSALADGFVVVGRPNPV